MDIKEKFAVIIIMFGGLVSTILLPVPLAAATDRNWAEPLTGMQFVSQVGDCFQMGDIFGDSFRDNKPVRKICVDNFSIGKYEVTNDQYIQFLNTYSKGNTVDPAWIIFGPNNKKGSGQILHIDGTYKIKDEHFSNYPVSGVSWFGARAFATWLSQTSSTKFRLPTEAEWEYAARSEGGREKYSGGSVVDEVAWYEGNSTGTALPIGTKKPNGSGLYDMSGNVMEWCSDWWAPYKLTVSSKNPNGPKFGTEKVFRGGAFDTPLEYMSVTHRFKKTPDRRDRRLGFRLTAEK